MTLEATLETTPEMTLEATPEMTLEATLEATLETTLEANLVRHIARRVSPTTTLQGSTAFNIQEVAEHQGELSTRAMEYDAMGSDIDWDNPEVDWEAIETASKLKRLKRAGESHKLGLRASPAATLPASARKPATKRIPSGAGRAETGVHLFVDDIAEVSDSQDEEEDSQEEAECLALERRERRCSFLDDSTQPSLTGRGVDDESPLNEQAMYQRSLLESPSPWGRRAGGARRRHSKRGGQSKRGGGLSGSRDGYLRRTGRRFSLLSSASLASGKEDGSDAESSDGESSDGEHYDECGVCGKEGELLLCDNCPVAVHVWCVGLRQVPEGDWLCAQCSEARTTKEGLAQPAGVFSGQLGSRPGAL
eukprot:gene4931-6014_t